MQFEFYIGVNFSMLLFHPHLSCQPQSDICREGPFLGFSQSILSFQSTDSNKSLKKHLVEIILIVLILSFALGLFDIRFLETSCW